MFRLALIFVLSTSFVSPSWSTTEGARSVFQKGSLNDSNVLQDLVQELAQEEIVFAGVPWLKKILKESKGSFHKKLDSTIEDVITVVGIKQFEIMPIDALEKSSAVTVKYILAKKYFRLGSYDEAALEMIRAIPSGHPTYQFALLLEGSIYSIKQDYAKSLTALKDCLGYSTSSDDPIREKQKEINHDYCLIGVARTLYAQGDFKAAELQYLDLPKSSFVWPEILFEEAWTSYNQGDFNRTLGKLVTYKSPFFDNIFNPEVDVLRALTFLKLCLYSDTKTAVDQFYENYEKDAEELRNYLNRHAKDYKLYYEESRRTAQGLRSINKLVSSLLRSIVFETTYQELYRSILDARKELRKLKEGTKDSFTLTLIKNNIETINQQKEIIGSYVRRKLVLKYTQILKSFEHMSAIKLEVLSQRKADLYSDKNFSRDRGDIKYLRRNEKQYFWTFNGEFWADELGDYVFALASECGK